jgi:hypothetical protein
MNKTTRQEDKTRQDKTRQDKNDAIRLAQPCGLPENIATFQLSAHSVFQSEVQDATHP